MRSNQEVFDEVARALRKQGKPSLDARGRCVYRSTDGCKCAAGWMIPDEAYDPRMEGASVTALKNGVLRGDEVLKYDFPDLDIDFLALLQNAHDNAHLKDWLSDWIRRMKVIALAHGLDASVLTEDVSS